MEFSRIRRINSWFKNLSDSKRTAILFSFASILMSFCQMGSNILIIKWVEPEQMGLWSSTYVIITYSFFIQLGIFSGLNRDLPFFQGKGEFQQIDKMVSVAQYIAKACFIIGIIVTIVVLVLLYNLQKSNTLIITISVIGLMSSIYFYQNFLTVTFRTNKSFKKLSYIYILQSFVIVSTLYLVYNYEYYGLISRFLIISLTLTILLHILRPFKIKSSFYKTELLKLIKTGLPIYSLGYLQSVAATLNRVILLDIGGIVAVGYYSPGLAIITIMKTLPSVIGQYLYPKMSFELGKTGDKGKIWLWVWKSSFYLLIFFIPFGILGWFILPSIITNLFPKYVDGIFAAQLSIVSGIISGSLVGLNALFSLKAIKTLSIISVTKFIMNIVFMYFFAHYMSSALNGVVVGLLISDIIFFIIGIYACYYNLVIKNE